MAPASSSFVFISCASSLPTASLTVFGAPSTSSFASFRPRPVRLRTSLITAILLPPMPFSTTSNSVCSSAPAAPSPPAAGPAMTAAAAAAGLIPYSSSRRVARSLASLTVRLTSSSAIFLMSAILVSFSCGQSLPPYSGNCAAH